MRAMTIVLAMALASCSSQQLPPPRPEKIAAVLRFLAETLERAPAMDASAPADASDETPLPRGI